MDGPTIQAATEPAVRAGVGVADALRAVRAVVDAGAAAVTMGYWNQVERYGVERFAADLAAAGGSGAITPDLIPDEAGPWIEASDRHGLDRIFLVAPSSTDARIVSTTAASRGFVYASAVMGVTGARTSVGDAAATLVARVRALAPEPPVCVGLGVSNGDQAAQVAAFADGVIVGLGAGALPARLAGRRRGRRRPRAVAGPRRGRPPPLTPRAFPAIGCRHAGVSRPLGREARYGTSSSLPVVRRPSRSR